MVRIGATSLLFLIGLLAWAHPVCAQEKDSTQRTQFRMADSFLQAGEYEKAIGILESLYEDSPDNASFYRKLKDAYESVKQYKEAVQLVEDQIDGDPTPYALSEKARLLYQMGDEEAANKHWEQALAIGPDRTSTYRIVYQTLMDLRRFRRAIEVLHQARENVDNEALFRMELAYLYGLDGQHRRAMEEYVALLVESPDRLALVRNRLQTFVEQNEGISASTEVLQSAVETNPLNSSIRQLLAWLYMKTDNYDAAYDVYRALDRLNQQNGQTLYRFAQKAADAERFSVATTAFDAILERYPDAEIAPDARRGLGNTYRRWAETKTTVLPSTPDSSRQYDAARSHYTVFLETYPNADQYPTVLARLGALQLDVYRDLDAAETTLEEVVSAHPNDAAADQARYDLGRIALLHGNLDRAQVLFSRLAKRLRSGDLANTARLELARLHYYQGSFEAARTQAEATSANTSADVSNDAIELSVLIQENTGPDSLNTPLRWYAEAQLSKRRRQYERAHGQLDSLLTQYGRHALADEARFHQAEISLIQGDTARAIERYDEVPVRHPRSPYADRSLFRLGRLYERTNRSQEAIELYDRLLTEYPTSLLGADARRRLRTLRRAQS